MSRWALVAHPAFYSMGTGVPTGGVRWLGCQVDCSPPSSAKLINEWSYTSIPPVCLHGVKKDNYTFSLCFSHKGWWEAWINKFLSVLYNYSQIRPSFLDEILATVRHCSKAGVIQSNNLQHLYKFKPLETQYHLCVYLISKMFRPALVPTQATSQRVLELVPGYYTDHSPLSSTQVRNEWSHNSTPLKCIHWLDTGHFTFTVTMINISEVNFRFMWPCIIIVGYCRIL